MASSPVVRTDNQASSEEKTEHKLLAEGYGKAKYPIASHATIAIIAMDKFLSKPVPLDMTRITKMSREIFVSATASPNKHSNTMFNLSPNSA
ncbi:hypothetical protein SS1G_08241 [Sclerotinia sclerotiorum 1980 UF-70]|uniref:Uncharacterized protein n=1 Tax=Sclerotinia sclerotiorum (strain ATCC 18683 / 1980 / Ss-1) TaxID=665079 RepID=A7ESD6_SCLS1|nr:hypothetical protein SS1G_08241 [Sclerotinia sclerotiorum 1980 UF-70]EDN92378.1 hypothetical protein SS1G_08241 [Sclerotinia sclerotiorum 1980 UF-70]